MPASSASDATYACKCQSQPHNVCTLTADMLAFFCLRHSPLAGQVLGGKWPQVVCACCVCIHTRGMRSKKGHAQTPICGAAAARDALVRSSRCHLEVLEAQRKVYLRSRAVALAQRGLLYAHDELDMSMMRMQLRRPQEAVKPHEQHFRLQPFEVPLKNRVRVVMHTATVVWRGLDMVAVRLQKLGRRFSVKLCFDISLLVVNKGPYVDKVS